MAHITGVDSCILCGIVVRHNNISKETNDQVKSFISQMD